MAKKHLLITLGLLITSQANGMAAMRNFGLWAKTWYKTAIFSSFATWHASYKFKKSALRKDSFETNPSSAVKLENPELTNEIHYKEFDKKQDTDFLLECLQKDAYLFLSSNIKTKNDVYSLIEDKKVVILYTGSTPVGFGIYSNNKINFLGISQEYRGKGYANKLIQHIVNILKIDHKKIILLVRPDNHAAIKLYRKFGFKYKHAYSPSLHTFSLNTQPKSQEDRLTKYWLEKYAEILM